MENPTEGDLRVWHIPQVPGKPFHVPVSTPREGALILRVLADYDHFQLMNNIKPDYCNAQGLEVFEDGEWCKWMNEDCDNIDVAAEALLAEVA